MENYGIIHFKSTHQALHAEILLEDSGFNARIIPTPGTVAQGCGFSIKYPLSQEQGIHCFLCQNNITHQGFYHIIEKANGKTYQAFSIKEG